MSMAVKLMRRQVGLPATRRNHGTALRLAAAQPPVGVHRLAQREALGLGLDGPPPERSRGPLHEVQVAMAEPGGLTLSSTSAQARLGTGTVTSPASLCQRSSRTAAIVS